LSNLKARTITGMILAVLVITSIVVDRHLFALFFFLITLISVWEFYTLVEKAGITPNKFAGTLAGAFLFLSNMLVAFEVTGVEILMGNFALIFLIFLMELYRKLPNPFTNIAFTIFGIIYVALPFALLNYFPNPAFLPGVYHKNLLLGFFFLVWMNETGAYLVGTALGRNRLFARISPKKSWEGAIGGAVLTLLTGLLIAQYYTQVSTMDWMAIGMIVVVFGSYGDLFESMLKRSINCKDSGTILPGHGGVLDRFDGVIMAAPFVFAYLTLFF
jgi:phosphatidate cytidylyltransferase